MASDPDMMPEVTPGGPRGTRRVNNVPLLIVFGGLVLFMGAVGLVMRSRSQKAIEQQEVTAKTASAESLLPKAPTWVPARMEDPVAPTPPPLTAQATPGPVMPNMGRIQALQAALVAPAKTQLDPQAQSAAAQKAQQFPAPPIPPASDVNLDEIRQILQPENKSQAPADITGLKQFSGERDRWHGDSTISIPSKGSLRTGAVIPGVLITGLNSDLPGTITAQVAADVYDTPTGQYLVIPQGARLIGAYTNTVQFGQNRLFVAWQRIIFPDGRALDIGAQPGTDGAGYSGVSDKVDNHYVQTFGSAVLLSAVVGTISYASKIAQPTANTTNNNNTTNAADFGTTMSQSLANVFGNVVAKMIEKNLSVSPTITVRPGFRFNVLVVKDFELPPYQDFKYKTKP